MCDISAPHLPNGSSTSVLFFEGVAKGIVYLEARRHRRIFPGGILSACSALLALTLLYVVSKIIYRLYFSPLATFPGPKFAAATKLFEAWHVIVKDDWLENLCALHDKYGPVVRIGPNELHFTDHKFCLQHHGRRDLDKCRSYYSIVDHVLGGLSDHHTHTSRKSMIQPLFTGQMLNQFSNSGMNTHLDALYERLQAAAARSEQVNATHLLWAFSNDVITSYLFGSDLGLMQKNDLASVHDRTRGVDSILTATTLRTMPPIRRLYKLAPSLRRFSRLGNIESMVKDSTAKMSERDYNAKEPLLNSPASRLRRLLTDANQLNDECLLVLFIGGDSFMSNLIVLLHHMIVNPRCIAKLREELDLLDIGSHGNRIWWDQRILQLKYLDALVKESTRLSAPSWHRQPRQVDEPVIYKDTIIPAQTSLSFTVQLHETDPLLYSDPKSFKPERWLGDCPEAKRARANSVTFGTGSRTCLGQFIVLQLLRKTIAAIIYNFDVSFWDENHMDRGSFGYLDAYPRSDKLDFLNIKVAPRSEL